jgi:hypothetical protein
MHGRRKIPHPVPAKEANWKLGRKRWTRLRAGYLDAFTYASVTAYLARYPGQRVAVALEQKRGALLYMLMKYEQVVLYPIHGATASKPVAARKRVPCGLVSLGIQGRSQGCGAFAGFAHPAS